MSFSSDRLVWVDCEMTGLDVERDDLIEIAVIVTDYDLTPLDAGIDLIIRPRAEALAPMGDFVRDMHPTSGLIDELTGGISLAVAEHRVLEYVRSHVPEARKAPLAGNSIGTDRAFLTRYMPALDAHLHYRNVDVSSIKELAKRWYPRAYFASPSKNSGPRALADILESILDLRFYRRAVFVPGTGPSSADLKTLATTVTEEFNPKLV